MMKMQWLRVAFLAGLTGLAAHAQQPGQDSQQSAGAKISTRQRVANEKALLAAKNDHAGAGFLASNQARAGVTTLPSGVQYRVLKAGSGNRPVETSTVLCQYTGQLTDGSSFDKSDPVKPTTWRVSGLLPGLKEALKLMPVGSHWEVVVPPQLAYGKQGNRGVGPNAVVIYDVELVGIL
jgi:FKBP-type peptidyl-prolyl cis-trans isomerase FklB